MKMTCDHCQKTYGVIPGGRPVGMSFVANDCVYTLCINCIEKFGRMEENAQEEFMSKIKEEKLNGR